MNKISLFVSNFKKEHLTAAKEAGKMSGILVKN